MFAGELSIEHQAAGSHPALASAMKGHQQTPMVPSAYDRTGRSAVAAGHFRRAPPVSLGGAIAHDMAYVEHQVEEEVARGLHAVAGLSRSTLSRVAKDLHVASHVDLRPPVHLDQVTARLQYLKPPVEFSDVAARLQQIKAPVQFNDVAERLRRLNPAADLQKAARDLSSLDPKKELTKASRELKKDLKSARNDFQFELTPFSTHKKEGPSANELRDIREAVGRGTRL